MKPLTVIIDSLVSDSAVARHLKAKGVRMVEGTLKFGQYSVTDDCTIWHLAADDLAHMLADRSLYRRIPEFKRTVSEPIVIIEGDPMAQHAGLSRSALRGALTFLALHNRLPILSAADAEETAELLYVMANQAQNGMGMTISETVAGGSGDADSSINKDEPPQDPAALQEHILTAIPEVSATTAKALLKRFGSLRAIFSASAEDLTKLRGIGPKKAKKIADFLSGGRD